MRHTLPGLALASLALAASGCATPSSASASTNEGAQTAVAQASTNFTPALFDQFVDARAGSGAPVYWYSIGSVRAFPSGELLFTMEGYDAARLMPREAGSAEAVQLSRKIYVMRDPLTNAVVRSFNGNEVDPIAYPYQYITYRLNGEDVDTFVEQGAGPRVQRIGPVSGMTARAVGNSVAYTAPLYLDIPLPGGTRMQVFENYDFFIQPDVAGVSEPHQLSWVRTGPLPRWAGGAAAVMHLTSWRVERYDDLPETIRAYVDAEAPLWQAPPLDLAEIRARQSGAIPQELP